MKKNVFMLTIGMVVGFTASVAVPGYAAVKQYLLTQVEYPIVVNGKEYNDPEAPILNYEGSTYIPLAKIGDLTGVKYQWNDELKRVEIGGAPASTTNPEPPAKSETTSETKQTSCDIAGQKGATLCPDTVIERPQEPGYKGVPDYKDPSYDFAKVMKRETMPPLLSEGWISVAMLDTIEGVYFGGNGPNPNEVIFSDKALSDRKIFMTIQLPKEFVSAENGDFTISGIRVKKYYNNIFFNISDLQTAGIIQK